MSEVAAQSFDAHSSRRGVSWLNEFNQRPSRSLHNELMEHRLVAGGPTVRIGCSRLGNAAFIGDIRMSRASLMA
jgi:hypothetical protein